MKYFASHLHIYQITMKFTAYIFKIISSYSHSIPNPWVLNKYRLRTLSIFFLMIQ